MAGKLKRCKCIERIFRFAKNDRKIKYPNTSIAFTMAEILLSLTIIGVVAAITLPSLTGNINERTWSTQRKALYSRISQAVALMGSVNGYGIGSTQDDTNANAAQVFVTEGLSKVLKINNICDSEHLRDCGIPETFQKFHTGTKTNFPKTLHEFNNSWSHSNNSTFRNINTNVAAFETQNGESIAVFYNPLCVSKNIEFNYTDDDVKLKNIFPYFCASFVYDLNGLKGPNVAGKDIWYISLLYSDKLTTVYVDPNRIIKRQENSNQLSVNQAKSYCASVDGRFATLEEFLSTVYNKGLGEVGLGYGIDVEGDRSPYTFYSSKGGLYTGGSTTTGVHFSCITKDK